MAKDLVNERVNAVMAELDKRQRKLDAIKSKNSKNKSESFLTGVKLIQDMISGQKELIDEVVFDAPKNALEQHRNLMLTTGNMNQTPQQGIKTATDAIDSMLSILEGLSNQR